MEEDRIIYIVTIDSIDNIDNADDEYIIGYFGNREGAAKVADGVEITKGEIVQIWEMNDETGERLTIVYYRTK